MRKVAVFFGCLQELSHVPLLPKTAAFPQHTGIQ